MILIGIITVGFIVVNILYIIEIIKILIIEGEYDFLGLLLIVLGFIMLVDYQFYHAAKSQIWQMINNIRG